jgi:eukaryotic-like serine/threonine-protein kinase
VIISTERASVDELNRDLLVAILAVLTESIPRDGLAAILNSWTHQRQTPLAQLLRQASGLDDEKFRELQSLAAVHLKAHGNDIRQSLYSLNAQALTIEVLTAVDDGGLRLALSKTLASDATVPIGDGTAPTGSTRADHSTDGARFTLIRPHASGGIGQVWLARDSELQREVAIKEIQPRFAEHADQRARFLLEAEVTGNLEHPGIVPVYSLGKNADGRPYYAMRFIRGESLAVAIRRFHQEFRATAESATTRSRRPSKWGVEFRQLVGRFLDVCNAIDYAHSRGVLHRDLKPANIMLGHYGETLVVDWGLAKVIGKDDFAFPLPDADAAPVAADESGSSSSRTEQGTTIGTPAYMSPEQASGLIDQLGPASDVYSLGASLYELLTGELAFRDDKVAETIKKVVAGDFPPPRSVDRSVPAPLESICLKAMARDPAARYDSVRALARDLEHWLADEPVAAHPERRVERIGRWIRQHRNWAVAGAALLLGIAVVASVSVVVVDGARRSETTARKEAETNFNMAQRAVEVYLTNVSENTLLNQQDSVDIRTLRRDLLNSALEYYKEFAGQHSNDPSLRRQLANAYSRVGQLTTEIGSAPKAIGAFQSAQAIWEPLVRANPDDHELAGRLADCYLAIGKIQSASGDYAAGMHMLGQSRAILERLAERHPSAAAYRSSLSLCYIEIGIVHARLQQPEESLAIHEKARAIQQNLISQFPDRQSYQRSLAENLNAIGYAHYRRLDYAAALRAFDDAVEICQSTMNQQTDGPRPEWLLNLLALGQYNIGSIYKEKGDLEKALPALERALGFRVTLAELHPSVTEFQQKLGTSYREVAELQHKAHLDVKALESCQRSVAIFENLVRSQPELAGFRSALALGRDYIGVIHDDARRNGQAITCFEQAIKEGEIAIDQAKDVDVYKVHLCYFLDNLGEQYIDLGRVTDGLPYYDRALRISRELHAAHRENSFHALELVKRLVTLGNIRRHEGATIDARTLFAEARSIAESVRGPALVDPTLKIWLAMALDNEANTLLDQDQAATARPLLDRAAALFRQKSDHPTPTRELTLEREARSEVLWDLARVLRALKLPAEASPVDAKRIALWTASSPDVLVDLALKETTRAVLIGFGRTDVSDRAKVVRNLDLDQAAGNLRLALERGFQDVNRLKSHPDASFLLSRDDLKTAIARLDAALQPKSRQAVESPAKQ